MTQKTFWRRVREIMNDQSSYPTDVPNLESWRKQQKDHRTHHLGGKSKARTGSTLV